MDFVLFGASPERARMLADVLRGEGYAPEVRVPAGAVASAEDLAATRGATIVFIDLALGTTPTVALCEGIRASAELVAPLVAILGEPAEQDVERLVGAGANMYFPATPETLARRTRFLREAAGGRSRLIKTLIELRAAEERNRQIEREHLLVLDHAPNPVFIHRQGKIVWTNPHGAKLLGVASPAAAVGLPVLDVVPEPSRDMIERRLQDREIGKDDTPFEQTIVRRDGQQAHLWVVGMPTLFQGEPAGIAFVRDLTEQRQLEMQLMASDRLASLGRLAASVGHEINNPLTYVLGNLQLALRALRSDSGPTAVRDLLEGALSGAEQVRRIVDDLRVFAQRKDEALMPVDVRAVIASCVRMTAGELRHRARIVEQIDDVPAVLANEPRLAQVITNLLLNAAQALPEGEADAHTVTLAARQAGRHVELAVEDTGEGIAPEHLPHVFEPFFTTKTERGGTGLGLAICKMLVASQGGELAITSTPGKGTRVTVTLPVANGRAAAIASAPEPPRVTPRRVLLVDDDAMVARVLCRSLAPHAVTHASSGREALRLLATGERFDAIVCDLMMPEMGGVDVYERIKVDHPGLERKMVFMTGGTFTQRGMGFVDGTQNPMLQKPFDMQRLFDAIEQVATVTA